MSDICQNIKNGYACFRVIKYCDGKFIEIFHQDVKKSQLSKERKISILHALVVRYEEMSPEKIIECCIARRKGSQTRNELTINVYYPSVSEKLIATCCGSNIRAECIEKI